MNDNPIQPLDVLRAQLEAQGRLILPANGISMGARWRRTRTLSLLPRSHRVPRWGDVVVYRAGEGWVAHRLVRGVDRNGVAWWVTKGDGAWTPDRCLVADDDVLGVVVARDGQPVRRQWLHAFLGWLGSWWWRPVT